MTGVGETSEAHQRVGLAIGLMVVSSVMISFGGLIVRNMQAADAWQINFHRSLALMVAVLLVLVVQYGRAAPAQVRRSGRAGIAGGALLGAAGICFLQSLTSTTVANTLFTLSAIPFITALLARLVLGERLRRSTLAAMTVAAAGIGIMLHDGLASGSLFGNAMALLTALFFAAFAVIVRRRRDVDMLPTLLVSALLILGTAWLVRYGALAIPWHDFVLCVLWGGVLSGGANWMFIVAARHLVAAELTLFMLLEFSLGPLWVWLFAGETPSSATLAGGVMVIGAVSARAFIQLHQRAIRQPPPGPL